MNSNRYSYEGKTAEVRQTKKSKQQKNEEKNRKKEENQEERRKMYFFEKLKTDIEDLKNSISRNKQEAENYMKENYKKELLFIAIDKNLVILNDLSNKNDQNWYSFQEEYKTRKSLILSSTSVEQRAMDLEREQNINQLRRRFQNSAESDTDLPAMRLKLEKMELEDENLKIGLTFNKLLEISNILQSYITRLNEQFEELKFEVDQSTERFHVYEKNWKDTLKLFASMQEE